MKKRLCFTRDGRMSMCRSPESKMGRGRCNHVAVYVPSEKDENKTEDSDEEDGWCAVKEQKCVSGDKTCSLGYTVSTCPYLKEDYNDEPPELFDDKAEILHALCKNKDVAVKRKLAEESNDLEVLILLQSDKNSKVSDIAFERIDDVYDSVYNDYVASGELRRITELAYSKDEDANWEYSYDELLSSGKLRGYGLESMEQLIYDMFVKKKK